MIAIEALSGRPPHSINHDALTGAVLWKERVPSLHPGLVEVLDKMLHHDFTQRYRSVQEVQFALKAIASELGELDDLLEEADSQEHGFELETADLDEESLGETIPLPDNWVEHP
jgi:serine/threonine protein kinase